MYGFHHSHYWTDPSHAFRRTFHPRRGGPRFFWFLVGAGTATWFLKRSSSSESERPACTWRHRRELEAVRDGISGHAPTPNVLPSDFAPNNNGNNNNNNSYQFRVRWSSDPSPEDAPGPAPAAQAPPPPPPPARTPSWPADRWQVQRQQWMTDRTAEAGRAREWEEGQARMRELAKVAESKVTELSEATLDSILATVTDLKAKLAQHKAAQEQLLKQEQQRVEEERRNPPRWV